MEILTLGQKVKKLRKEKQMTLKELAGERVTAAQISFIELGKSNPSHDLLEYLAEKLDRTVDYFIETEEEQARKYSDYFLKIATIDYLKGNYDCAKENIDKSLHYSDKYYLSSYQGKANMIRGDIAFNEKDYPEASKSYLVANQQFVQQSNIEMIIETYIKLGKVHVFQKYYLSALDYLKLAERYVEQYGFRSPNLLVDLYYNIIVCLKNTDNRVEIFDYIDICNDNLAKLEDKSLYGDSLLATSIVYKNIGDFKKALFYANKSLEIFEQICSDQLSATVEKNIGSIMLFLGDIEGSIHHTKRAIEINKKLNTPELADSYLELGKCYLNMELFDLAESMIKEAQKVALDFKDHKRRGNCYYYLYKLKLKSQNYDEAIQYLDEYIDWMEKADNYEETGKAYIEKGNLYNDLGSGELALENFAKGYKLLKEIDCL